MRREARVTVQGPVKKQQPDGMSHRGGGGAYPSLVRTCRSLQEPDTWGGAIELAILSFVYCTEIVSLDVQTARMDVYGQGEGYVTRVFVLYTGKHYDAMAVAPTYGAPESQDQVMFNTRDERVMQKATQFVAEGKGK